MLTLDGYTTRLLGDADVALFQDLWERCSDFHELSEGKPTRPTAAADDLVAVPPGRSRDDKFLFGIFENGLLVGVLDILRDWPKRGEWWIGLLMLDPRVRSRGLGRHIVESIASSIDATVIGLGVLEANPRAERFWRSVGFEEVNRQDFRSDTGKAHRLIVMRRNAGVSPAGWAPSRRPS